jgi:hypothetical protein
MTRIEISRLHSALRETGTPESSIFRTIAVHHEHAWIQAALEPQGESRQLFGHRQQSSRLPVF